MYVAHAPPMPDLIGRLGCREPLRSRCARPSTGRARAATCTGTSCDTSTRRRDSTHEAVVAEDQAGRARRTCGGCRCASTTARPSATPSPTSAPAHLHHIDQRCGGEVAMDEVVTSERAGRRRFLVNSLMEEAIRSSQFEGATTSRRVAKELLRSGREPRDRSERMIANNYRAIQFMREEMGDDPQPRLGPRAAPDPHRGHARRSRRRRSAAAPGRRAGRGLRPRRR